MTSYLLARSKMDMKLHMMACWYLYLMRRDEPGAVQWHGWAIPLFFGDNIILDWDNTPAPQENLVQIAQETRTSLEKKQ